MSIDYRAQKSEELREEIETDISNLPSILDFEDYGQAINDLMRKMLALLALYR